MESGHFDKLFFKKIRRKGPTGKILELLHPDTPKTAFSVEDATQGWTQLGPFFEFSKKSRVCLFSPPLIARLKF